MLRRRTEGQLLHPARLVAIAFAAVIAVGTLLLALPVATPGDGRVSVLTALFTATSATCVTGLVVVDTATAWSTFGKVTIAVLIQIGGFGIMTFASLLAVTISRRIGMRIRMAAHAETSAHHVGDVRRLILGIAAFAATFEIALAAVLTLRFWRGAGEPFGTALGHGVFHSVSAFNNAGFALFSDSLVQFVTDPWICLPIAVAVIAGGLGFPVLVELSRNPFRPRSWSMHAKLTVGTTAVLLLVGTVAVLGLEWSNPNTLGPLDDGSKALASFFQGVTPRTAGFNTLDYSLMRESTWLVTMILMFIGGGSASTAGGIKVTTFALLGFVIWSELRGQTDVVAFRRRAATAAQRQALTVALLAVGVVVVATLTMLLLTPFPLSQSMFEVISAFGVVGLSTGITYELPGSAQVLVIVLMFLGRIGPATMGVALVLRERERLYRYPEERPLIG